MEEDFNVVVVPSDRYGVDPRPLTTTTEDTWHDCPSDPAYNDEEFPALDALKFFRIEPASDNSGNRIIRVIGRYFPGIIIIIIYFVLC